MKFSCDRCGQRYITPDEPKPGQSYRIPCLACGGTLRLRGWEFPALPTAFVDTSAPGAARPDAAGEEPVLLALAPMAHREPLEGARPQVRRKGAPRREGWSHRWTWFAGAAGVALATVGAGFLLVSGRPIPEPAGGGSTSSGDPAAMSIPSAKAAVPDVKVAVPDVKVAVPDVAAPSAPPREAPTPKGSPAPERREREGPRPPAPATRTTSAARVASAEAVAPAPAKATPPLRPPVAAPQKVAAPVASKGPGGPGAVAVAPEPPAAGRPSAAAEPAGQSARPTQEDVAAAFAAKRPALDACLQESLRNEPGLVTVPLKLVLALTVDPSGIATSPQLDDPALQDTILGGCLRNVARQIVLPAFAGERFQARIPLRLGE